MAKQTKPDVTYETLKSELDAVLAELQRDDLDIDKALAQYQRGLELTSQLEAYLKTAKNKVTELKAKFSASSS